MCLKSNSGVSRGIYTSSSKGGSIIRPSASQYSHSLEVFFLLLHILSLPKSLFGFAVRLEIPRVVPSLEAIHEEQNDSNAQTLWGFAHHVQGCSRKKHAWV